MVMQIWDKMASHNLFLKYLLRPLETLIKAVHVNHDERVPLIFTFDEVSNLVVKQNDQAYVALRRVLRCLRSLPVWSFFLSTQLALAYIAPATVEDPSARIKKRTSKRLAPFFSFPMDVGINHEMRYNLDQVMKKPLRDFSSARHMALFGRILWRGYQGESCTTIRELALAKLLSQTEFDVGDRDHVFAVLANRICLDPCVTNRQTAELAETAVNSHLRVILEMDSDNGLSRTTTISEPIVAEAVAYLLNPKKPIVGESSRWSEVLRTLITRLLTPGLIDKGRTGELTMRILATLAKDRLLASGNAADQEFGFSKVFSVASFLRRLLNPVFADMVLKSEARLGSRLLSRLGEEVLPSCEKAFEAGLMNFTHFVATEKEMLPEDMPELLHGLMLHQAALQLGANQSAWDILIPIYNGDPAAPFDRTKLSAILIQVKNRVKPEAWTVNKEKYDSLFPDNPILSIIVELGVTYSSIDMLETFRKDHFSYRINGMGSTTYACWDPQLDPLLRQLLNIKWSPAKEMEKQVSDLTVNFRQHAWVLRYPGYADGQENVGAEGMKRKALGEDEEGREKKEKDAEVKEVKKQKKEKAKRQKQK